VGGGAPRLTKKQRRRLLQQLEVLLETLPPEDRLPRLARIENALRSSDKLADKDFLEAIASWRLDRQLRPRNGRAGPNPPSSPTERRYLLVPVARTKEADAARRTGKELECRDRWVQSSARCAVRQCEDNRSKNADDEATLPLLGAHWGNIRVELPGISLRTSYVVGLH
jgi:hypothetical protein